MDNDLLHIFTTDSKIQEFLCQTHCCIFCFGKKKVTRLSLGKAHLENIAPLYSFRSDTCLPQPTLLCFLKFLYTQSSCDFFSCNSCSKGTAIKRGEIIHFHCRYFQSFHISKKLEKCKLKYRFIFVLFILF